ncbi:MAG TPA: mannosyltransferase family protein [Solirubrobacteraceae bacterium]|nr:mannosyltransferase family protein [Solirubrobacteraceae bacterium]
MSTDTIDQEGTRRVEPPGSARPVPHALVARPADSERMDAVRDCWRALWCSRLLVWAAGVGTIVAFGYGPTRKAFNPPGLTRGFGWLGNLLAAPAARWDSVWYLVIAHDGYRPDLSFYTSPRTAFFPLYPLGLWATTSFGVPAILAGVLLSLAALALALYGIHRLTTLELACGLRRGLAGGRAGEVPRLAVLLTAFAPMAFFFSAVYSESLYLALSVGLFLNARRGRWMWVGVLGALAGATRSTGLVLALPAVIIYLYGPREDRPPDRTLDRHPARHSRLPVPVRVRPRYRLRREALWLALLPLGAVIYGAYLGLAGGDPLSPLSAQNVWGRHFAGPYVGVWDGLEAAIGGARQLLSFQHHHLYFPVTGGSPFVAAGHNLMLFAFLLAAIPAIIGVLRRLPLAYGAYVIAALALPLSDPVSSQPLMSLPRFLLVLFPLTIWLAIWLSEHPPARRPTLALSGALMAVFVAQFATWHWVA